MKLEKFVTSTIPAGAVVKKNTKQFNFITLMFLIAIMKPIILGSAEFINGMVRCRYSGKKINTDTTKVLSKLKTTTNRLNDLSHQFILDHKAVPASLNYKGFPKSICTSLNHVICHGIPNDEPIKEGDIISIDIACVLNGYYGDICKTFPVENCSEKALKLIRVTEECLKRAIQVIEPYKHLGDIGNAIQSYAEKNGFSVVEQFVGHGTKIWV